ncbi:MAG TPA: hypothetical protein VGK38_06265, partial [Prolixibacteraceae bacterium]
MVENIPNINIAWLVPALPLLGFLITGLGYKRLKHNQAGVIASTMVVLSFLISTVLFFILQSSGKDSATVTL